MFHVHVVCEPYGPVPQTATFVRSLLPLTHPVNAPAVAVTYGREYRPADVVLVERVWSADLGAAELLVARARLDGVPLVYVTDDNLLDLDPEAVGGYVTPAQKTVIEYLARSARGLIVSTKPLRDRMAEYNPHSVVVPNAVDERLFAGRPAGARAGDPLVIGYMGTATHDDDLAMVIGPLRDVLGRAGGGVEFELVGGVARPETLAPLKGLPVRVLRAGDSMAYPEFMRWLAGQVKWDMAIAPLADTPLNRCKSDLKFLDYGALGVPAVYSNVTAYRESVRDGETGLLADNTSTAWRNALQRLLSDADLRTTVARHARRYVFARRTLRHTARRWATALRILIDQPAAAAQLGPVPAARPAGVPLRTAPPVLVVVPGSVNYFHNRAGERLAAAARGVGLPAEVHTLQSLGKREGGCVLIVNPAEAVAGHPDKAEALALVQALARRHDRVAAVILECARTHWYTDQMAYCASAGIDAVIDLGFVNQYDAQPAAARGMYRFVVNGLTADERRLVDRRAAPTGRPIPWVFVGHHSAQRADLVGRLVRDAAPGGLVYLPSLSPVADGGPHLGERSYLAVLGRAAVQVWCSHHEHFYMESERFRMSLLAGGVPVKAVSRPPADGPLVPFHYLMPTIEELPGFLREIDLAQMWARFADDFLSLPSLEEGIGEALAALGVTPGRSEPRANGSVKARRAQHSLTGRRRNGGRSG